MNRAAKQALTAHLERPPAFGSGHRLGRAVLAGLLLALGLGVQAQTRVTEAELPAVARRWLDQALVAQAARAAVPLRLQATLGVLDGRLRLAACARVEPYLPPGSRLWGKTRLGLRCVDGVSRWNVFMPVTVTATGVAWVVRRDVAPGTVLAEADLMPAEVDWAQESSPIVSERAQWLGWVATRALGTGQALRQNMVRAAQVFQAGTQVRVLVQGGGFLISSDGQALSAGVVGQLARVRMDSGRVMSGLVLDARTVRLEM